VLKAIIKIRICAFLVKYNCHLVIRKQGIIPFAVK
jgi:hypothetical protein